MKLEEGIVINIPEPKTVKLGLLLHSSDNLEAHTIGGYSGSFSSKSICRFCHCQYEEFETRIHDCDGEEPHARWSIQEYDNIARSIEMPELVEEDETSRYPGNIEGESNDSDSETDNKLEL